MSGLGAFVAGLGTGAVSGMRYKAEQDRLKKKDQMEQETHDAQMAEVARKKDDRVALVNAARPATVDVGANGVTKPAYADNSDVGQPGEPGADAGGLVPGALVNGQAVPDAGAALSAAAAYNAPAAVRTRQAAALDAQGNPAGAIALQNATMSQDAAKRKEADDIWRQKVGVAMQGGHQGLAQLITQTEAGPLAGKKAQAVPSADGKTVNYSLVNDDGSLTPTNYTFSNDENGVTRAGFMLDRAITPEHRLTALQKDKEIDRKTVADDNRFQYQQGLIDTKIKQLELTGQVAEARALAAASRAAAKGDPLGREERLRYTALFTDAGRRMQDTEKTINSLQRDPLFMVNAKKPGTPEAQQLESLRSEYKSHGDERTLYQGLLANGGSGGAPSLATVAPKPSGGPVTVNSKAERDKLAPGTHYIGPDGQAYIKQ